MKKLSYCLVFCISGLFYSCEKEKTTTSSGVIYTGHGIFIVNEGSYGSGNGSISYMDPNQNGVIADLYKSVNGVGVGDVVQSMNIYNGNCYIVVNNSQKVEVTGITDFHTKGTITGFMGPRYFLPIDNNKAYVSDWFSNSVKVIDLSSLSIINSIPVGAGPEQMAMSSNKVYVTNVGGFGNDSTVSIIDPVTNSVVKTIVVGLNPNSIITKQDGKLLVLCGGTTGPDFTGGTADDIGGRMIEIDPATDVVSNAYEFALSVHPVKLVMNTTDFKIYFLSGSDGYTGHVEIFDANAFVPTSLISGSFYGIGIHPADGKIYCGRPGFSSKSYILRFMPDGALIDSSLAGIGPNGFAFN